MSDTQRSELNAVEVLLQDHREVESLFRDFESRDKGNEEEAEDLIDDLCIELEIYDVLENEIFYPAVRKAAGGEIIDELLDDAADRHDTMRELVEKLYELEPDDAALDSHVSTLAERAHYHIQQEESGLFLKVRELKGLDLIAVAADMKARRSELLAEMGVDEESVEAA